MDSLKENSTISDSAKHLIDGESNLISTLANISALIHSQWSEISHWCGFYLVHQGQLELGPFQGPIACTKIQHGKGVCGESWDNMASVIVDNVHDFKGHIVCSSLSNSEIVVPIIANKKVVGVLDVDSIQFSAFNSYHQKELELICANIATQFFC